MNGVPIEPSELIINSDGSIFHLHLRPEDIAETIILVGDPERVGMVSKFFTKTEIKIANREFVTHTGYFNGKRVSAMSTGIGTDNIDIVVNEIDALVNIDFKTRLPKEVKRSLRLVRIGTSGALQKEIPVGTPLVSESSIGFDGLLNYYSGRNEISDIEFEEEFKKAVGWNPLLPSPYVVNAGTNLLENAGKDFSRGINISAAGFYGPQGRVLRLGLSDDKLNDKITEFSFKGRRITNYEMESSAIYGLSKLLGHEALTICLIIANRVDKTFIKDYKPGITRLIEMTLQNLTTRC